MIQKQELEGLSESERLYLLAGAYLDAACFLALGLKGGNYQKTFSHAKVILSLQFHSVELFLKYALICDHVVAKGHNIRDLYKKYAKNYPDPEFEFSVPFLTEIYDGVRQDDIEKVYKAEGKIDQLFRYHQGLDKTDLDGIYVVCEESFVDELLELRNKFNELHDLIEGRRTK
ncbi:MAG: hypothetical protein RDU13_04845 [Elusimicrobiales bacterium]|nr:hypothetical protein [Elusimicrobiales bacterium]